MTPELEHSMQLLRLSQLLMEFAARAGQESKFGIMQEAQRLALAYDEAARKAGE